jgi:2-aminoadipate transaminase
MNPHALSDLGRRTADPPISWLMKMTLDHPQLVSLAAGFTDSASLPVRETRKLLNHLLRSSRSGQIALQYGSTPGDPRLRTLTANRLRDQDAAQTRLAQNRIYDPERLLITHGSQQLLYMMSEALCNPGDIVLVEDPTYFVCLGIAQSHGLHCRGIRLHPDGLDLDHLEQILEQLRKKHLLPRLKLLYLVTYFQNPSGATTSLAKKTALLHLLRRYEPDAGHPLYLLEDAAYRELRFSGQDVPSALTCSPSRVIYTGTYSKPFATGARVGFGILPDPLHKVVLRIKGNHDFGTANLLQQLLAHALDSQVYSQHLALLRKRYARKARIMAQAIQEHFPNNVRWDPAQGGLYLWVQLPTNINTSAQQSLFQEALRQNVLYVPGNLCYAKDPSRRPPTHQMRLSFGGASEPDIRQGIRRLGQVLQKFLPR